MIPSGTRARVTVPATSANLGPGFDALGLALGVRDEYEVVIGGDEVAVTSIGQGATQLPTGADHLVARSLLRALSHYGMSAPGLTLTCRNVIPQSRGMGSSAAAIVGGAAMGAVLADIDDPAGLVALSTQIEGHPDNVAAAALGGLTVSWMSDGVGRATALHVLPQITPVLFVPSATSSTEAARAALPAQVSHGDAAFNAGRSALLVAALTSDPDLLPAATQDRLHQQQRRAAYAQSLAVVAQLRSSGWAAVISGAGPTVLVLAPTPAAAAEVAANTFDGFATHVSEVGSGVRATRIAETLT